MVFNWSVVDVEDVRGGILSEGGKRGGTELLVSCEGKRGGMDAGGTSVES